MAATHFSGPVVSTAGFEGAVTGAVTGDVTADNATVTNLTIDTGTKTATATAGAATLSKTSGKVTSEALTTAAAAAYTLTITNTTIAATDLVFASVANGTNSAGVPVISRVTPGSGSVVIVVQNEHASAAFNGTIVVSFMVVKV